MDDVTFLSLSMFREECGILRMIVVKRDAWPLILVKKEWVPVKMILDAPTTISSSAAHPTVKHLESSLMTFCTGTSCYSAALITVVQGYDLQR